MLVERASQIFFGHSSVHALDHPRVRVTHCYTDEVRRDALQTEPRAERAAEVVGAHGRDAGAPAGIRQIELGVDSRRTDCLQSAEDIVEASANGCDRTLNLGTHDAAN